MQAIGHLTIINRFVSVVNTRTVQLTAHSSGVATAIAAVQKNITLLGANPKMRAAIIYKAHILRLLLQRDRSLFMPESQLYNRSEEHTSELQSRGHLVCRLLLEKKKTQKKPNNAHE